MAPDTAAIPLPNETYDGATVVASVWVSDDDPVALVAMLLLIERAAPFYRVQDIQFVDGQWENLHHTAELFPNIVPAVEAYTQRGGDY